MRKFVFLTLLLITFLNVSAQHFDVKSFQPLPMDMTATSLEYKHVDQNGITAALIKVVTSQTGFFFDGGTLGILDTKQMVGEIWVWVPYGSRKITISHQQLGVLRDFRYPVEIESGRTYEMVLTTDEIQTIVKAAVTQQFLLFEVSPKDAIVTVNGEPWIVDDGVAQKMVDFGEYEYRVEAADYHPDAGRIKVDDPNNKVTKTVSLKPAFGFLKIEGNNALLAQASIFIDNRKADKREMTLGSGKHTVKIIHPKYKPFERIVTINDSETYTLNADLDANFSSITLKVDGNAEIWVNSELKGTGTWTGDLGAGNYTIECRKKNHRSTSVKKTITENMSGETITLLAPTPINGTLVVSSSPAKADILIDGKKVGETPMRVNEILIGEHTLKLEKKGCASLVKSITIEEGKTLNLDEKLETGRNVTLKTDRNGDKVFVDNNYVGETPCQTALSFGQHTIRATRGSLTSEKSVSITEYTRDGLEVTLEFGRMITITTDSNGDLITIDGKEVGKSPLKIDLPHGIYRVHAKRGKKFADKTIMVQKSGGDTSHHLVLHGESASNYVANGVGFLTFDAAYSIAPQFSYGLTFGSVKRAGWFVTAASNFAFDAMNYAADTYGFGETYGFLQGIDYYDFYYPVYTGKTCTTRISVMAGLVVRIAGPVYMRLGAGFGTRVKGWYTSDGQVIRVPDDCYTGVDAMSGLQLNLKGLSLSLDAVTTNFKTMELKLGVGFCWKKK